MHETKDPVETTKRQCPHKASQFYIFANERAE
jgi:hypothetical protein